MKVDHHMTSFGADVVEEARQAEEFGYAGASLSETDHDPFLSLPFAATATSSIQLGTGIAIAFARSPMTMAVLANDAQLITGGRFQLGLGSQIKAHIVRRFSMPWSRPADRMREYIAALRAVWACWNDGTKLDFTGDFYTHTLMPPFFNPGPNPYGTPKVALAAVGTRMVEVAGEMADGILCHGFSTERYLREVTLPALARGSRRADEGRRCEVNVAPFVVTGTNEEEFAAATSAVRKQIAFYGSTPAYRGVLELHGWGELQTELQTMTRENRWDQMGAVIDDEILNAFAIVGEPDEIGPKALERFGDLASRMVFYTPYKNDRALLPGLAHLIESETAD